MSDYDTSPPRSEKEIFFESLERLTPQERAAFLDGACGANAAQRARVDALLADHFQQDGFMERAAVDVGSLASPAPFPSEAPAQMVGRYKLLEKIGEGGFGEVWMAEQREPVKRRVALKIVKPGMDSRQIVARFEAERQALAMLEHAHIARIFDADMTATGRPYFVMELIRGVKITEYCDHNQLPTRERLGLFIKVCHAIQHAHQIGIIHRDIKPSNVLVTMHDGVPVPKVIDFGIAKATQAELTDKTVFTQFQHFIGTPAYISPEQAEMSGLDIDTRADIYSLGVLLYELLVGQTPFDAKEMLKDGLDALRRIIRERDPLRPSTRLHSLTADARTTAGQRRQTDAGKLVHLLRGDLDWIVMKCLEKDRRRRYDTANGLAMDIQRHLDNEPVVARPPSAAYKIQKAWQRNKLAFSAAGAVGLALLAGTGVSTWQAVNATRARRAEVTQRIAAQNAQAQAEAQERRADAERLRAESQLKRTEWLVYAGKLMLAQTDFEAGNGGLALHYLDECEPGLRGWEHRYLSTRINARQTLAGHAHEVSSVAFSPDGQHIVAGSMDGTAKVWDAATGQDVFTLQGHKGHTMSVAFSPDGKRIVTGGGEWGGTLGEAKVWDAATGRLLLELNGHTCAVWSVVFSPDGKRIATGAGDWGPGPGEVKVWDAETGREILVLEGHMFGVRGVAFSPDGRFVITGSEDYTAKVWDAATGRELITLHGHTDAVRNVAFSPDGRHILTGSMDWTAKVWDAGTGKKTLDLAGHSDGVTSAAFSPDGQRIVTGSWDQTAKVWDAVTGREVFALKGHAGHVCGVAFSPDGQHILTGSEDGTAKVWDAVRGQEIPTLKGHDDSVSGIAFSPDSQRLVTCSRDGRAKVWDTATGRELLTLNEAASGGGEVVGLRGVAFSPDGQRIVTGGQEQTAKVWDAATGRELLVLRHTGVVYSVAFSPDGRRILTGVGERDSPDITPGEAKVWDATTGRELLTLEHPNVVRSVAFSPDGQRIVTGSGDRTARVWDAATGAETFILSGHTGAVNSVAFSPDGRRILTGSRDRTAKVWDAATGQESLTLKGHTGAVRSTVFSPDGQRIVTGSDDRTAKIWEASMGQEALTLKGHTHFVWSVAFSPDGRRIVTGIAGADAVARIWHAEAPPRVPETERETATEMEASARDKNGRNDPAGK